MNEGLMTIYQNITGSWFWSERPFDKRSAWMDLVLLANKESAYSDFNGKIVFLNEGQAVTSVRVLADRWGWKKDAVIKFLGDLENERMIDRKSDKIYTIITIIDYSTYYPTKRRKKQQIPQDEEQMMKDFEKLLSIFPNKIGRTRAFGKYKRWVTAGNIVNGKRLTLNNRQIWYAISQYRAWVEENKIEEKYQKHFDTFLGETILDYIDTGD